MGEHSLNLYLNIFKYNLPYEFIVFMKSLRDSSLGLNSILTLLLVLYLLILSLMISILLILFSILIQSLIYEIKFSLSHSLSICFPLSNETFIFLGSFSPLLIISSLKYLLLNKLSIYSNNLSSLSLRAVLIFVKAF